MKNAKMESADPPEKILEQLGLSRSAAICYWLLVQKIPRALPSSYIQEEVTISSASLFRAMNELSRKGFINVIETISAKHYRAEPLSYALDNYALYQREQAQPLIQILNDR